MIRYCAACDTEFRPEIDRCSDCGGPLESIYPEMQPPRVPSPVSPPPEGNYVFLLTSSDFREVDSAAARLREASIPFVAGAHGWDLFLRVRPEDLPAAQRLLKDSLPGFEPRSNDSFKGYASCPACGEALTPGARECPSCTLVLSAEEAPRTCSDCGSPVLTSETACPGCGRPRLA